VVKVIKFHQEKLYTVKAGIIFNRPVPFTETENISSVNRTGVLAIIPALTVDPVAQSV